MSIERSGLNIGVISDCALQRHALTHALNAYGLSVVLSCEPELLSSQLRERVNKINCWILELEDEDYESCDLDRLIEQNDTPVLVGLGKAPAKQDVQYISWERRLFGKLDEHLGYDRVLESEGSILALEEQTNSSRSYLDQGFLSINKPEPSSRTSIASSTTMVSSTRKKAVPAENVWVLAASLGGPAAVKVFLDEIPATIRAGFLYAQHVDAHFSNVLTKVLGRHSKLELKPLKQGCQICEGEVLVVPVDNEVTFKSQGAQIKQNKWDGPYGPSIDHLLKNLFQHYGSHCHVIVFSGMGNDGALFAPTMKKHGCSVWTQTPSSCANGSMPQSVIDIECSSFSATPSALAQALIQRVGCSHPS